jgi:hypothetical protein
MFAQVDDEGHREVLLDKIIDHRKNEKADVTTENAFLTSHNGTKRSETLLLV